MILTHLISIWYNTIQMKIKHTGCTAVLILAVFAMLRTASARDPFFFRLILWTFLVMTAGNAFISGASQALVLEELDDKENLKTNLAKMRIAASTAAIIGCCIGLAALQFVSYRQIWCRWL